MTYLLVSFLPSIVSLFVVPAIMLLVGKQLKIVSVNLNYWRMMLIAFIGLLLGNFFQNLFPLSSIIATAAFLLIPIKTQLKISWGKAAIITLSGLVVIVLLGYLLMLFI